MIKKIKHLIIPSLIGLGIFNLSISAIADSKEVNPSLYNYHVDVSIPSTITIPFTLDGTSTDVKLPIKNSSLLPITLTNVNVSESKYWKLVGTHEYIKKDVKELSLVLQDKELKVGDNILNEYVEYESSRDLNLFVKKGIWTKAIKEEAFKFNFDYDIHDREFDLTFDGNGGSEHETITELNGTDICLPEPSRIGYTFAGWEDKNGVVHNAGDGYVMPVGGDNLTAKWTPNPDTKYVVNHYQMNLDGSTYTLESTENKTGTTDSELTTSSFKKTYTGFTYLESKVADDVVENTTIKPDGTLVIDLYYSRNKYGFDLNGYIDGVVRGNLTNAAGSVFARVDIYVNDEKVGDQVTDFTSNNYPFYYGSKWEVKNITVSTGRQYNGLYAQTETTSAKELSGTVGTNNTIVNLDLSTITYNINYNLVGGTVLNNPSMYNVDTETFTLSNPVKTGYTFLGWTGDNGTVPQTTVTIEKGSIGNKTYTANWKANTYTVKYNGNGATSGSTSDSTHTYDVEQVLTTNGFSRLGYTFAGWNTNTSGTGINYSNGQLVKNLASSQGSVFNLYAKWNIVTYSITYNLNGGTNPSTGVETKYNVTSSAITLPIPTKTGYSFGGWYENSSFSGNAITSIPTGSTGNKVYYAKWTPVTYTITYNLGGGSVSGNPSSYTIESDTITLNNPARTGYTFLGWTGSNGTSASTSVSIAKGSIGNKTYTANWKANEYTYNVKYVSSTGKDLGSTTVKGNFDSTVTVNAPAKAGYTTPASQNVTFDSTSAKTITFTYPIVTYSISYNLNGGSATNPSSYNVESSQIVLSSPTKTGHTFSGWTGTGLSSSSLTVTIPAGSTGDRSYTANWTVNNYTLTYNANGGSVSPSSATIAYGSKYGTLPTPTRTGYTFKGWFTASSGGTQVSSTTTMGAGNTTIYAQWSLINYSITYNLNGGTNPSTGVTTSFNVTSAAITLPTPTRTGYTFGGWFDNSSFTGTAVTSIPTGSINNRTYYAKWTVISYSISYDLAGGSVISNPSMYNIESTTFTLNNPTRVGYTFAGWTGSNGSTPSTSVSIAKGSTGNKSYTANWTANKYTVVFNGNGNTGGTMSNQTHTYDTALALTSNAFTKTGYAFQGWNTKSDGSGTTYTNGQSVKNLVSSSGGSITLYAIWKVNVYTYNIKYVSSSGLSLGTSTVSGTYGSSTSVTAPVKLGYSTPTAQTVNFDSTSTKTITFTYNLVNYTINYSLGGGSISGNKTSYNVETATFSLPAPTRTGYTFKGWTGSNGTTASTSVSIAKGSTGDKSYTANWTANTYTINYNANGGTGTTASSSHTYGTAKALTSNGFSRTGYTFLGWSTNSAATSATYTNAQSVSNLTATNGGTVTLYAIWKVNTYTYNITYKSSTGKALGTSTVSGTYGSSKTVSAPAKTGYTTPSSQTVSFDSTSAKTITFTYPIVNYTIGYTLNSGTVSGNPTSYNIESAAITLKNPTRTGYTFKGWTGSNGTTASTSVTIAAGSTGNKTYTANWTVNNYTATFNGNGGSNGTSITKAYGSQLGTLPTTSRTGYTFKGWFTAASGGTQITTTTTMPASNVTYYAQWTAHTYTVAYNANGGSGTTMTSSSHTYGTAKALTSNTYTRKGYTFAGWATSASGSVVYSNGQSVSNLTATNGATVTLYAKWTPITYTIAYNGNGNTGGSTASSTHTYDVAKALTSNGFTKTGYSFAGWATSTTGSVVYSNGQSVTNVRSTTGTTTLYAKWNVVNYSITYNLNGGTNSSSNPSSYNVTSSAITLANPTRTGYTFGGWYTESSFTNKVTSITTGSTGNKTFYAKWTANTYTVSYDANGGSGTTASSSHTYGTAKTLTSNGFRRTGYTFLGWSTNKSATSATYTNAQSVTNLSSTNGATVKLYAVWKANSYTYNITYVSSSGKSLGTSTVAGTFGTSTTVSAPSKTGYTTPSSQSVTFDSTTPKTIKFTYPLVSYTIGYTLNGGSASNPTSYNIESSAITLNAPTRTGYKFTGWTGSNGTTASTSVSIASGSTGNKTYTANWKANSYTIKFNSNGGSGTMSNLAMTYGTAKNLTSNSFTRTGYTFAGWATSASGAVVYSNGQSVNNLTATAGGTVTLYAKWTANTYTVAYNGNGNTGGSTASSSHTYGVAKTLTANGFTKTGHNFAGWATSSSGAVAYSNSQSVSNLTATNGATVTLYAKWNPWTHTVAYNANGGSGAPSSQTKTYGTSLTLSSTKPTRTGYTFAGWNTNSSGTGTNYSAGGSYTADQNGGTVTLYAKWTANTYKVTFNANGGSTSTSSKTVTYASTYGTLPTPTRTGYIFKGWYTASSGGTQVTSSSTVSITANQTLYAQWTANTYTIKFNANGGSGSMSNLSMTYGTSKALTKNTFTRTGYTFLGWSTSSTATTATYTDGQSVSNLTSTSGGTVNLYAVWKPNSYTVTFNANGGSTPTSSKSVTPGGTYGTLPTPTRTGYTFNGWYTATSGGTQITSSTIVNLTADQTLYAQWTVNTYTLTYNPNGGSVSTTSKSITYGSTYGTLPTPTRSGYTFKGWYTAASGGTKVTASTTMGAANTTIYAQWTAKSYTLTLNGNGGSVGTGSLSHNSVTSNFSSLRYSTGRIVAVNGLNAGDSVYDILDFDFGSTLPEGEYSITLTKINSSASITGFGVLLGGSFVYPSATENGLTTTYTFDYSPSTYGSISSISLELTMSSSSYVSSNGMMYTVSFTGPITTSTKSVKCGSAYGTLPTPTRNGYTFKGWYTAASGGTKVDASTIMGASSTTIYAQWQ